MYALNRLLQGNNGYHEVDINFGQLQFVHRAFSVTALEALVRIGYSRGLFRIGCIVLFYQHLSIDREPGDRDFHLISGLLFNRRRPLTRSSQARFCSLAAEVGFSFGEKQLSSVLALFESLIRLLDILFAASICPLENGKAGEDQILKGG